MRSTIAAVDALPTPPAPTQGVSSSHDPDGDVFAIGFGVGFSTGILTAVAVLASGWLLTGL
jgi:hypothetical protein